MLSVVVVTGVARMRKVEDLLASSLYFRTYKYKDNPKQEANSNNPNSEDTGDATALQLVPYCSDYKMTLLDPDNPPFFKMYLLGKGFCRPDLVFSKENAFI